MPGYVCLLGGEISAHMWKDTRVFKINQPVNAYTGESSGTGGGVPPTSGEAASVH